MNLQVKYFCKCANQILEHMTEYIGLAVQLTLMELTIDG